MESGLHPCGPRETQSELHLRKIPSGGLQSVSCAGETTRERQDEAAVTVQANGCEADFSHYLGSIIQFLILGLYLPLWHFCSHSLRVLLPKGRHGKRQLYGKDHQTYHSEWALVTRLALNIFGCVLWHFFFLFCNPIYPMISGKLLNLSPSVSVSLKREIII